MSDLYIMFDEAYDSATPDLRNDKLEAIAKHYKIALVDVQDAYCDYTDSDQFYYERGI